MKVHQERIEQCIFTSKKIKFDQYTHHSILFLSNRTFSSPHCTLATSTQPLIPNNLIDYRLKSLCNNLLLYILCEITDNEASERSM